MALIAIRVVVFILALTAVGIAVVPIVVMLDLVSGGTGYGLCPGGLETCELPYTTGAELVIILTLALFGIVVAIRLLVRLARKLRNDTYQVSQ
ncbi:MAG: hypothetical protein L0Z49_08120 [Actinobacteria bacterium]|nr:hypothetical protein [Actinomycetota bacterium]MCI0544395.1 hypothetical protein [Actinomycetota bacterium]